MEIHFIDVGCGNMTLLLFPNGTTWLYDCNVTDDNEVAVLRYLTRVLGNFRPINAFICSHRDADHMRGIKKVHRRFPLGEIWDNDVPGTTTDSPEYREYMDLRRQLKNGEIRIGTQQHGDVRVFWINSKDVNMSDANDQSIVVKFDLHGTSALFAGDTSYRLWCDRIVRTYGDNLKATILIGSHHGSLTFFDDPSDSRRFYTDHIARIKPVMTLISVGPNVHDLPNKNALTVYEKHSSGSNGHKVWTTQDRGNMKLAISGDGAWTLSPNQ